MIRAIRALAPARARSRTISALAHVLGPAFGWPRLIGEVRFPGFSFVYSTQPACGGGSSRSEDHEAPATAPVRLPDTQGRCPPAGGSHWSCLGVLAVVPGRALRHRPIRSGGSSPDRHGTEGPCGPRAQAVCGGPSLFSCRRSSRLWPRSPVD